jgi:hypothetical protein
MLTEELAEELARRFGAKLRGRDPEIMWQTPPVAMTNLLRAIARVEQQRSDNAEECRTAKKPKNTSGK